MTSEDKYVVDEPTACEQETEKAILVTVDGAKCWVPKSQVHDDSEVYKAGTEGTLVVSAWFARKCGWL